MVAGATTQLAVSKNARAAAMHLGAPIDPVDSLRKTASVQMAADVAERQKHLHHHDVSQDSLRLIKRFVVHMLLFIKGKRTTSQHSLQQ